MGRNEEFTGGRGKEILRGFHGGKLPTPEAGRNLYMAPLEVADAYARDNGEVWEVEYESSNPLHYTAASDFARDWEESGAGKVEGNFYPESAGAFTKWAAGRGHDAVVLSDEVFDDDSDQKAWEVAAGTFGDPQTIIIDGSRARVQRYGS